MTRTVQRRRGAAQYFGAALAIRTADAGSAAAVVLLVLGTGDQVGADAGAIAAVLAACITIPHMLGPLAARAMSLVSSPRLALCSAFGLFAVLFAAAGALVTGGQLLLAAVALVIAGFFGPIFTGGLSSHLGTLVAPDLPAQRRAQSADSLTYALSNAAGNLLVGAVAAAISPIMTVYALSALAVVAAGLVVLLPLEPAAGDTKRQASMANVFRALWRTKALRDISVITFGNAFGLGSLVVLATSFARDSGLSTSVGPVLVAVMAVGSLSTALYFIARPMVFDVMVTAKWCAVISGVFIIAAAVPNVWVVGLAFLVVGGCQSILNTTAFAVRREASSEELRASVFVTMAGIKIAFGALGLALAGLVPVDQVYLGFVIAGLASLLAGALPRVQSLPS